MPQSSSVRLLYRNILKAAKQFPSIKRDAIVQDIKMEFREAKNIRDEHEIRKRVSVGLRSLDQLRAFAGLNKDSSEWEINLRGSCE